MIDIVFLLLAIIMGVMLCYIMNLNKMDSLKNEEPMKNNLIKEIESLDDYSSNENVKNIMVPDNVDIKDPTLQSTQADDCKKYTVTMNKKIEKTVIGNNNTSEDYNDDSSSDNPIKFV